MAEGYDRGHEMATSSELPFYVKASFNMCKTLHGSNTSQVELTKNQGLSPLRRSNGKLSQNDIIDMSVETNLALINGFHFSHRNSRS